MEPSGTTDTALGSVWSQLQRIALVPRMQPGMLRRKAGAFAHEIIRLHQLGYSQAEIRLLLSDIGVHIAKSTVGREIQRWRRQGSPALTDPSPASPPPADLTPRQVEDFSQRLQTLARDLTSSENLPTLPTVPPAATMQGRDAPGPATPSAAGPCVAGPRSLVGDPRSGREIATEFLQNYNANPLFKRKGKGQS